MELNERVPRRNRLSISSLQSVFDTQVKSSRVFLVMNATCHDTTLARDIGRLDRERAIQTTENSLFRTSRWLWREFLSSERVWLRLAL